MIGATAVGAVVVATVSLQCRQAAFVSHHHAAPLVLCSDSGTILFLPTRRSTGQGIHGSMSRNVFIWHWSDLCVGRVLLCQFLLVLVGSFLGAFDLGKDRHIGGK